MKLNRLISSLLLAIYVMASSGGMLSVILCHCPRSQHITTHHSCHYCAHHNSGEGIKLPADCCGHDHSTEIDLYNHEKSSFKGALPVVCSLIPALQESVDISAINTSIINHLDRRKTPLFISEFVATKGLRAPPVIA